jgi:hypothetical protein
MFLTRGLRVRRVSEAAMRALDFLRTAKEAQKAREDVAVDLKDTLDRAAKVVKEARQIMAIKPVIPRPCCSN